MGVRRRRREPLVVLGRELGDLVGRLLARLVERLVGPHVRHLLRLDEAAHPRVMLGPLALRRRVRLGELRAQRVRRRRQPLRRAQLALERRHLAPRLLQLGLDPVERLLRRFPPGRRARGSRSPPRASRRGCCAPRAPSPPPPVEAQRGAGEASAGELSARDRCAEGCAEELRRIARGRACSRATSPWSSRIDRSAPFRWRSSCDSASPFSLSADRLAQLPPPALPLEARVASSIVPSPAAPSAAGSASSVATRCE